ncbi:sulfotransferase [Xanthomarina gelatinilytica]|uniref:Sulfotransferase n=2 Tax=Xanthomarina gelatinilytica TaxID=1137281 RepID=M7NBU1_9FLAO|nr:sulfotransferase [Xanthomarina gelatinilytica]
MQGNVQYMFDTKAIKRIFEFDSDAKLICVLRNPVDRAISAHKYFSKLKIETLTLSEAIKTENERSKESLQAYFDFTYKAHGLYAKQLKEIFSIFNRDKVLILLYDNLKQYPEECMKEVFNFLEIDEGFTPDYHVLNATGKVKYQFLQNLFFSKSKFRKYLVDNLVDPILPLHKRTKIRWAFNEWNTKKEDLNDDSKDDSFFNERQELKDYFFNEIEELEKLLNINLNAWKH